MMQSLDKVIYKYHEHQSLLENKEDEVLNEDERKAAWEEFENEKKGRPQIGNFCFLSFRIFMNIIRVKFQKVNYQVYVFQNVGFLGLLTNVPPQLLQKAMLRVLKRDHPELDDVALLAKIPEVTNQLQIDVYAGKLEVKNNFLTIFIQLVVI